MYRALKQYHSPGREVWDQLTDRPRLNTHELEQTIRDIFDRVQKEGDRALKEYTTLFDKVELSNISVTDREFEEADGMLSSRLKTAIDEAYENISTFHKSQIMTATRIETTRGVECWREARAIERVGLYIPGGSAPLFSTVLMLAIPAGLAGCKRKILCTPPNARGKIHPAILYAAKKCGITEIFKVGGAQAIAAMTFGTSKIPQVYKIFGPGNQFVTAAKMKAFENGVAIDLPAGPSEVLVFSDSRAHADFVASDLLAQAEHGPDSQVVLVTMSQEFIEDVNLEISRQLKNLPRREIADAALEHSFGVYFESAEEAFSFINQYAPEHLIISSDSPDQYIPLIESAGSVFLGHHAPESAGDYASGTNHTLPTSAYARSFSGVSLDSYVKKITFQKISREGLSNLGPSIIEMARAEQLEGHAHAVKIRIEKEGNED